MKKNTIKFWLFNRFTMFGLLCFIITIILFELDNKYLNAIMFCNILFCWLGICTYLIIDKNANASERLMWQKIESILK